MVRLSKPLCLGRGKLRLGVLGTVRGLCFRTVPGRSRGPICYYRGLLWGPLCDMFGCQCVRSNMLICDELLCAMAITLLACLCVIA